MEYIDVIVEKGNREDMERLGEILEEVIEELDQETCHEYKMELYTMAYGEMLTDAMAEKIVHKMKPYGQKWSKEDTTNVKNRYGLDVSDTDFYVVMNSAYNDYKDVFQENIDMYVKYSNDFIKDEDAKPHKVFNYFTKIV